MSTDVKLSVESTCLAILYVCIRQSVPTFGDNGILFLARVILNQPSIQHSSEHAKNSEESVPVNRVKAVTYSLACYAVANVWLGKLNT